MTKKAIIRISIFYLIGITLSNIFRLDLLDLRGTIESSPILIIALLSPLGSVGLLIGAIISIRLLRKERKTEYSLFGTSNKWSLIMVLVPVVLLSAIGVENLNNENPHYYGLLGGIGTLIYCLFEEMGWRGYLQEELKHLKEWPRALVIGFLWYFWHLSFIDDHGLASNLMFLGWMIFGSWGIGKVVDSTKSILAATCFHVLINIMMFNQILKNGLGGNQKLIILGVAVGIWFVIIKKWEKEYKVIPNETP